MARKRPEKSKGTIMKKLCFAILVLVLGCTTIPPTKGPDYIGRDNMSFGQHSIIIDKRYSLQFDGSVTNKINKEHVKCSYWHFAGPKDSVSVYFREILNSDTYYKPVDWSRYYSKVLYYEKTTWDDYEYRMIRREDENLVIATFHFVGNQRWIIIEYHYKWLYKFNDYDANRLFNLSNEMIHIRHNKRPKQLDTIENGIKKLNSIFN